jgi:beta-lactamase regulating signal transducer with metallopeptidase domain
VSASFVAAVLLNSLWESTVFAALAAALLAALRPSSAAVRHRVWAVVLLKFAVPTEVLFAGLQPIELALRGVVEVPPAARPTLAAVAQRLVAVDPAAVMPAGWLAAGIAVWMAGAALVLTPAVVAVARLSREVAASRRPPRGREARLLARASRVAGCARPVRLHLSSTAATVMVAGWRRPVVVVPDRIARTLSDRELTAVLVHELTHVRRGDPALGLACTLAVAICWMHPLVWPLARLVEREREFACDDAAVAAGGSREDVSRGLAKVVRAGLVGAPMGLARAGAGDVARRLDRLGRGAAARDHAWTSAAVSAALVTLLITLTAVANPCLR